MFNRKVAEIKGWQLPKQTDRKDNGSARDKQKGNETMPEVRAQQNKFEFKFID